MVFPHQSTPSSQYYCHFHQPRYSRCPHYCAALQGKWRLSNQFHSLAIVVYVLRLLPQGLPRAGSSQSVMQRCLCDVVSCLLEVQRKTFAKQMSRLSFVQIPRIRKPNPRIYGSDDESSVTQKLRRQTKSTVGVSTTSTVCRCRLHVTVYVARHNLLLSALTASSVSGNSQ